METSRAKGLSARLRRMPWKRLGLAAGLAGLLAAGFGMWVHGEAVRAGRGLLFDTAEALPPGGVGLVFGCNPKVGDRDNLYFLRRIDAAVALWKSGKVRALIVSGDNRTHDYNEAHGMRDALLARGVPEERIVCDYAGLSTLDSVVRAREIFGAERVVFVSQRFQNERAAYLARAHGLDFTGLNARDVQGAGGLRTRIREAGARVKMWLDVRVLGTRPRHLGARETLPAS
jgi:SanA protein